METFDSSTKDELYRALENSVVKKEFKIEIPLDTQMLDFPANNIYAATFDASSPNNEGIVTGTSRKKNRLQILFTTAFFYS